MNPLNLTGPKFLGFYAISMVGALLVLWLQRFIFESKEALKKPITDPYLIAYLRGGAEESIRVAVATLLHRKDLKIDDKQLISSSNGNDLGNNEFEKKLIKLCEGGCTIEYLTKSNAWDFATDLYEPKLVKERLVPNATEKVLRISIKLIAVASLVGLALAKIGIAMQRGHKNFGFLIALAVIAVIVLFSYSPRLTPAGANVLRDFKNLFARLKTQASSLSRDSQNHQFAFLMAVFGLEAASSLQYTFLTPLKPKKAIVTSGSNSCSSCSSCSSGSSSSSCSSCGSSCGGGCGGGCGGCGS